MVFPAEFPNNPLRPVFDEFSGAKVDDLQRLPCDLAPKSADLRTSGW